MWWRRRSRKLPHKFGVQLLFVVWASSPYLLLIHFRYDSQHRGGAVIDKQTSNQTDKHRGGIGSRVLCADGEEKYQKLLQEALQMYVVKAAGTVSGKSKTNG